MTKHYVDVSGNYLGAFDLKPSGAIEAPVVPEHALSVWNGSEWSTYVEPVPTEVTMRQARLALLSQGHLTDAENALNGLSEPDKSAALIEWEYALSVDRNSTLVQTMITLLGLTTQEADDLFTLAASL